MNIAIGIPTEMQIDSIDSKSAFTNTLLLGPQSGCTRGGGGVSQLLSPLTPARRPALIRNTRDLGRLAAGDRASSAPAQPAAGVARR
jgi:hypothetical protein